MSDRTCERCGSPLRRVSVTVHANSDGIADDDQTIDACTNSRCERYHPAVDDAF